VAGFLALLGEPTNGSSLRQLKKQVAYLKMFNEKY